MMRHYQYATREIFVEEVQSVPEGIPEPVTQIWENRFVEILHRSTPQSPGGY
jgi:hypothetical protein